AASAHAIPSLTPYPGRGPAARVAAGAARHAGPASQVIVTAGADAGIGYICQAVVDPDDEVVIPWPSFPSFLRDTQKRGARAVTVPLRAWAVDLAAMSSAVTDRTRLVFVATPNNPTGLVVPRGELIAFLLDLPSAVLPVIDEAYFDYLDPSSRFDSIAEIVQPGGDAVVLRTFSKLYGLAGLRVGYAVGPEAVIAAMRKVQRGYDVGSLAQAAALASLADADEVGRRRIANRAAVAALVEVLRGHGLEPLAGSATNFVFVEVGDEAERLADELLAQHVAVQAGAPFGAPTALRIGAGSAADLASLDAALRDALDHGR
ncbi:MAG: histidinol-phosphate aminotransferase family protein, partial [Thermoleophilia bacterium]|nr:histidinol-phosphate aminotransferase family protein [Thermoleophilia bacterium]